MRIGLHIGNFHWPGSPANLSEKLVKIAQMADASGFYSLTVMDHLFQLGTQYGEIHGPKVSTTTWRIPSTRHVRLASPIRRSSSVAAARQKHCALSRAMPMPAIWL